MRCSSSGLLIYAALVDLLAQDFLSEEANLLLKKKDKIAAFSWVMLGGKPSPSRSNSDKVANTFGQCSNWHVHRRRLCLNSDWLSTKLCALVCKTSNEENEKLQMSI